jgi:hypothetical protein
VVVPVEASESCGVGYSGWEIVIFGQTKWHPKILTS